jgi:hypothetical protein
MKKEEPRQYIARFAPAMWERMERMKNEKAVDYATVVRRGVERELKALENPDATPLTLRIVHGATCGEWRDADVEQGDEFELSPDLVRAWNAIPGDELLHTSGASMLGAGIPEEAILHMRPFGMRMPRDGQVCAILAIRADGTAVGTVKHWHWAGKKNIELRDGERKKVDAPADAVQLEAVSFHVGGLIGLPSI